MKTTKFRSLLLLITLICIAGIACKNADDTCLVAPTTAPLNQVNLKFINKSTGADLLFGAGAPYKFSDLQVTGFTANNQPHLFVDSADKSDPMVIMVIVGQTTQQMTLKLGALPADTISAVFTTTQKTRCYSYTSLNTLSVDDKTVCAPCSTAIQTITIKK